MLCVTSLPLMGIRNSVLVQHLVLEDSLLTTPHGDQKQDGRSSSVSLSVVSHYPSWGSETFKHLCAPVFFSSSHYPSWGSETSTTSDFSSRSGVISLPLMWIRNGPRQQSTDPSATYSLPLMGIRNTGCWLSVRTYSISHYPSWGSETGIPARKGVLHQAHYPSWGSETGGRRPVWCCRHVLTTPHGDQKPAVRTGCNGRIQPSHYPSWGSETVV